MTDNITSLQVITEHLHHPQLALCEHVQYKGKSRVMREATSVGRGHNNDIVSSHKVQRGAWLSCASSDRSCFCYNIKNTNTFQSTVQSTPMTSFHFCIPSSLARAVAVRLQILQCWGKVQPQQDIGDLDLCLCLYYFFPLCHRSSEWESSLSCCAADLCFSVLPFTVLPPDSPHEFENCCIWSNERDSKIRDTLDVCDLQLAFRCPVLCNVKAVHGASVASCINKTYVTSITYFVICFTMLLLYYGLCYFVLLP